MTGPPKRSLMTGATGATVALPKVPSGPGSRSYRKAMPMSDSALAAGRLDRAANDRATARILRAKATCS